MIKPLFILVLTLVISFFGVNFILDLIAIPKKEILSWLGIILFAFLVERLLKYILNYPLKLISNNVQGSELAQGIQNIGFACTYICLWLAIGITPINAIVSGKYPEHLFSNPTFLKISLIFLSITLLFTLLWSISVKLKRD